MNAPPRPLAIVLTTSDRADYLHATCTSIDAAGAADLRRVIAVQGDPPRPPAPAGWEVYLSSSTLDGSAAATIGALCFAYAWAVPYLLLFEDDLVAESNAVEIMQKTEVPADLAYLSFFDSRWLDRSDGRVNHLLELRPLEGGPCHYGNLALKFPGASLARVPELIDAFVPTDPNEMDVQLPRLFAGVNQGRYGLYCPSLVQHVGVRSGITPGEPPDGYGRTARNWLGDWHAQRPLSTRPARTLCMEPRPGKA